MPPCRRKPSYLLFASVIAVLILGACEEEQHKPNETNTYNVHLYYGKDVKEHKKLGQVVGISACKTKIHTEAARMTLKPHTYKYECCWLYAGDPCYEKHK